MNPVTRRLLDDIDDPPLADFALAWDAFEETIVRIYRAGDGSPPDGEAFAVRRRTTLEAFEAWEGALEPYWRLTRVDGAPPLESPFREILRVALPREIPGNRNLLRLLPPAREALNGFLLDRGRREADGMAG